MKVGRQWRFYREDIDHFLKGEQPAIALTADIGPLLKTLRERLVEAGVDVTSSDKADPLRAVTLMLRLGVANRASDVHLDPRPEGTALLRYRIDGVLQTVAEFDQRLLGPLVEQTKRLAQCDVRITNLPQDGRLRTQVNGKDVDFRLCILPTPTVESAVIRILSTENVCLDLERLGLSERNETLLRKWATAPWGLMIVTGPTGSGKTTTLYSALNEAARPEVKTISIEDPVEYRLPHTTQTQIRTQDGLSFEHMLRAALRSDPDVILVGEIRNLDTLDGCLGAALTGHLVMTTLHTEDAASALRRMIDIGAVPSIVADATRMVMGQRLVRRLCKECAEPMELDADLEDRARQAAEAGGLRWASLTKGFRRAVGCPACRQTGYRGRLAINEALEVTPEMASAIRREASQNELRSIAIGQGMATLAADGIARAANGEVSLQEVLNITSTIGK